MRRSLVMLMVLVLVVLPSALFAQGKTFGATFMSMNNAHFQTINAGLKAAVEARGDKLITLDPDFDAAKQQQQLEDFVQQHIDGLFISPVDGTAIMPAIHAVRDAGIPIIVVDAHPADESVVQGLVSANNFDAGYQAGLALCRALHGKGKVGFIDYYIPDYSVLQRGRGFRKALSENPGVTLVVTQTGKGSTDSALPIMENILQSDPDIDGMFCINDPTAAGVISACEGARKKVLVTAVDGSQDAMRLIKAGKQLSTSSQNPKIMAATAAAQMYKVLAGQKIEHYVEVPITLINAKNVDQYFGK